VAGQIETAPEAQIEILLHNLTRSELLVNEARKQGVEVRASRQDSLVAAVQEGVLGVARELGFLELVRREGESLDEAAARGVRQVLEEVVSGDRQVFPLGTVSFAMRKQFGARIYRQSFEGTVKRIDELRAQEPPPGLPTDLRPETPPDTFDPGDGTGAPDPRTTETLSPGDEVTSSGEIGD
jgi:hypothetical protein